MPRVSVQLSDRWSAWRGQAGDEVWSRGGDAEAIYRAIRRVLSNGEPRRLHEVVAGLRDETGTFGLVVAHPLYCVALADRVRSFPLLYFRSGETLCITDRALQSSYELSSMPNSAAWLSYACSGYATGRTTLYEGIHQLMAGEVLLSGRGDGSGFELGSYFNLRHSGGTWRGAREAIQELDMRFDDAIRRTIRLADGRRIAVPLTGGLDSRAILAGLVRANAPSVVAFTYGRRSSPDVRYASRVASELRTPWVHIPYSNRSWTDYCASDPCLPSKRSFAGDIAAVRHIQDRPALSSLKAERVIDASYLVVPGHTGDFISGGHIPHWLDPMSSYSHDDLVDAILAKHFSLFSWSELSNATEIREVLKAGMLLEVRADGAEPALSAEEFADEFERWEWRERQAKYIVNSVRSVEHFALGWALPLWDDGFVDFWSGVPLEMRLGSSLWVSYVEKLFSSVSSGRSFVRTERESAVAATKARLKHHHRLMRTLGPTYYRLRRAQGYWTDDLASFGVLSPVAFQRFFARSARFRSRGMENVPRLAKVVLRSRPRMSIVPYLVWATLGAEGARVGQQHRNHEVL